MKPSPEEQAQILDIDSGFNTSFFAPVPSHQYVEY